MDAKHAKTLSGVVVALLIGSVLATGFTAVAQTSDNPGSIAYDVTDVNNGGYFHVDGEYGQITFNTSWEVTFSNLEEAGKYALYFPAGDRKAQAETYADRKNTDETRYNVTFPASAIGANSPAAGAFDKVGSWKLAWFNETSNAWQDLSGALKVNATENLRVTLSQDEITYTGDRTTLRITVTEIESGKAVAGAAVDLGDLSSINLETNANGVVEWSGSPAAGEYTIEAYKGAEYMGKATFTVNAASFDVNAVSTNVFHGFDGTVRYTFDTPADGASYGYNVTAPGDCVYEWGYAGSTVYSSCSAPVVPSLEHNDGTSYLNITAANTWQRGTYTLRVLVDADSASTAPEYTATVQWSTRAPSALNLDADTDSFDVGAVSGGKLPSESFTLTITGATKTWHPDWSQAQFLENFTLSGDFLRLVENGNQVAPTIGNYNAATGEVTVSGLHFTRGGGSVAATVKLNSTESTVEIPVEKGASLSGDASTLVVDQTGTLTFDLRGPSGAADPYGLVQIFRLDNGNLVSISTDTDAIRGDGSEGRGLDGRYAFALKESELGTYVAVGTVGSDNYAYTTFRVVPAHDLQSVILDGSAFLGTVTSEVKLNVTRSDGSVLSSNPDVFVLNTGQLQAFLENGALPTGSPTLTANRNDDNELMNYTFEFTSALPDTYTVYVRSQDGKIDNLESMPAFTIAHPTVSFSPTGVASNPNIQSNTSIQISVVDHEGNPLNGTLKVNGTSGDFAAFFEDEKNLNGEITIEDGTATVNVTGYKIGSIGWTFQAKDGKGWVDALGTFEVLGPNVAFAPERLTLGVTQPLTVTLRSLEGEPLAGLNVTVCGFPLGGDDECAGTEQTDENGQAVLGFTPTRTGDLFLYVGGEKTESKVRVGVAQPGLRVSAPSEVQAGEEVGIFVGQVGAGSTGVGGVTVTVTQGDETVFEGETASSGLVRWTPANAGTFTIAASATGYEGDEVSITVTEAPEPEPEQEPAWALSDLSVAPSTVELGNAVQGTVTVANDGTGAGTATLVLRVNGVAVNSMIVSLDAGESDTFGLTFTPSTEGTFEVTASLEDATAGPATVTVQTPETPQPPQNGGTDEEAPVPAFGVVAFALAALGAALVIGRRN